MSIEQIRKETRKRLHAFLQAKREVDQYIKRLDTKYQDEFDDWTNIHPKTTPIVPGIAIHFFETACKLKPYLLFWEFLRFRFLGTTLTLVPDFISDSLQLHALINKYLLSLRFIRQGRYKNRWYFAQEKDDLYGEFGVFNGAVKNLESTLRMSLPIEKQEDVVVLIDGDSSRGVSQLLNHNGEQPSVTVNGETKSVKVHHSASDKGRMLSDAYGINKFPSLIYNGMAMQDVDEIQYAKTIAEDAEDSVHQEVEPYFQQLEDLDLIEALRKSIKKRSGVYQRKQKQLRNKGLTKEQIEERVEDWHMPWEDWMQPIYSGDLTDLPEQVSPDYYLVKATYQVREILPQLKQALSKKYRNFFRKRPEMFVSLQVMSQATHDIIGNEMLKRLALAENVENYKIHSNSLWESILLLVSSMWECKGYKDLINLNVTDITSTKDRIVFIIDKDCPYCEKFFKRPVLKRWRRKGKYRGIHAEFHDSGTSSMGKVWNRRLYLITSPKQSRFFQGREIKRQKVKTRDTPIIMWSTRIYGNKKGEGFGDEVQLDGILTTLLQDYKDELLEQRRSWYKRGKGYAHSKYQPPPTRQPQPQPQQPSPPSAPSKEVAMAASERVDLPEEYHPRSDEGRKEYAYRLYNSVPNITQDEVANYVARYHSSRETPPHRRTISRWCSDIEERLSS